MSQIDIFDEIIAETMVRANLPEWCGDKITTMAQLDNAVAV